MWLYTCLQKCRRGKGGVQPRKLAAGNDFFSGSRKGTDTASNWSRGILHTGQLRLQRPGPDLRKGQKRPENKHILNICKWGGAESWALGCGAAGKTAIKPNLLCSHSYYSPCDVITFWIKWFQMAGRMLQMSQQCVVTAMLVCLHWFCKLDHRCWDAETVWKCW